MKTLIIIKPHAVKRGIVGEILSRFERQGIKISALKVLRVNRERAERLYAVHKGKPFYNELIEHITSSPVVVGVLNIDFLNSKDAIKLVRKIVGATDPLEAEMGTIRGDFGLRIDRNIIHASDSVEAANYEIPIFFEEEEIIEYE
ncbi:MAG: nucleoside-diphosphate kinase [Candidatus Altiarchaeales archaeon]|nr:MAG: nucleoside-diphosphate kinase [Candidatus Altiarchaeales archaeon]RLI93834.1 MAG: nucleoside-diphosphate kinase [Candidatus Altiarchaeales archaeon]RLI94123.1 MAG: nucleoside-diphosphate kinase [Candidatus Altiarchaeales archaeon]